MTGLAELAVMSFAIVAAATSLAGALSFFAVRAWLCEVAPSARARLLSGFVAAPLVSGAVITVACFIPTLLGDHCVTHDDHHAHFCFAHGAGGSAIGATITAAFAVAVVVGLFRALPPIFRSVRASRRLSELSRRGAQFDVLPCDIPLAVTIGSFEPRVVISTRLIEALAAEQLRAVVAHEAAHVLRRDNLRKQIASVLSLFHLPAVRRALLDDLAVACERASDEDAALAIGDRLAVAEALIAVERMAPPDLALGSAFVDRVEARVTALLVEPETRDPRVWPLVVAALVTVVLASDLLHDTFESLVALLS
jgi:Zn-dependent protease with chaperone function